MKTGFKKILTIIGVITVTIPASLSVAGCDFKSFLNEISNIVGKDKRSQNQIVVDAINHTTFRLGADAGDFTANKFISAVCIHFIQNNLQPKNVRKIYNDRLFILLNVWNGDRLLSDEDMSTVGTIKARIQYNYGSFKNQSTTFIIDIDEKLNKVGK